MPPSLTLSPQLNLIYAFYGLPYPLNSMAMTTQLNLFTVAGAGSCSCPCCCCVLYAVSLGTKRDAEMPPWHLLKDHTLGGYALLLSNEVKTHWHFAGRWIPSVATVSRWSLSLFPLRVKNTVTFAQDVKHLPFAPYLVPISNISGISSKN